MHGYGGWKLAPMHRRPRVVAFVRDWTYGPRETAEIEQIRTELRGLGSEMVVVSEHGVWLFGADDAVEAIHGASHQLAASVAVVARAYGVDGDRDAVFVIGADRVIRFAHVSDGGLANSLVNALIAAGDALHSRRTPPITFTRREWATSCLVGGFALALLSACRTRTREVPRPDPQPDPVATPTTELDIVLDINGAKHALTIDPRTSLLDALRERLGLTGTKKGCDGGQCGACTVHIGGQRVVSCLTLAAMAEGQPIRTIEGLASRGELHAMQTAFIEHDAFQCGFCTPGQIMSAVALLAEDLAHTDDEVREHMSGNICRCGAYPNIVAAVRAARRA